VHDLTILGAISRSQDGSALALWQWRNDLLLAWLVQDQRWRFTEALNALLVLAYSQAADTDELENDLHYAKRQIEEALAAVQREVSRV
jgi:hypothetical protein